MWRLLQQSLAVMVLLCGMKAAASKEGIVQQWSPSSHTTIPVTSIPANTPQQYPAFDTYGILAPSFSKDILDVHLQYEVQPGASFDLWFFSEHRVVYSINGGTLAPCKSYQTAAYQCIRPGELWQINWLEETGTVASVVYDIKNNMLTNLMAFSKGANQNPTLTHGDKRNETDFARWKTLANIGNQRERLMISGQVKILNTFRGAGNLVPIDPNAPTW